MPLITYDTCIMIQHKPRAFPNGFRMSAIVIQELTVGASDSKEVNAWKNTAKAYEKKKKLLVPTGDDWWFAGKVLNSLLRGLKSNQGGETPKLHPNEKHRIIRDVLIAVTAKRVGATIVTDNLKDFEMIQRFCAVKIISGKDHFGDTGPE